MADPKEKGPWEDYAEKGPWEDYASQRATMEQAQRPVNANPPEQTAAMQSYPAATEYGLKELGRGIWDTAKGFGSMLNPTPQTPAETKGAEIGGWLAGGLGSLAGIGTARLGQTLSNFGSQAAQVPGAIRDLAQSNDPTFHLGMAAPRAAGQGVGQIGAALAPKAIGAAGEAINRATAPAPAEASIPKAFHVSEHSPLMQGIERDVAGARPYLGGKTAAGEAPTLKDVQSRIPGAKAEVFQPIEDALELQKDRPVTHEGETTTVKELQNRRNELSAQRSRLTKGLSPEKLAELRATGEGKLVNLDSQIESIDGTLDPVIEETGIDPKAIRRQYGSLKGVERRVSGKTTTGETPQPGGVRKMIPFKAPGVLGVPEWQWKPIEGIKDIRAGQPWAGKPTDVAIGQLFGEGGTKPNLGTPVSPRITAPSRMLPRGPIMMGSPMEPIGQASTPAEMLPYQPSLQQPPSFVRPGEIRPAPGTMELLPPETFGANRGLFDLDLGEAPPAPEEEIVPKKYRKAAKAATKK